MKPKVVYISVLSSMLSENDPVVIGDADVVESGAIECCSAFTSLADVSERWGGVASRYIDKEDLATSEVVGIKRQDDVTEMGVFAGLHTENMEDHALTRRRLCLVDEAILSVKGAEDSKLDMVPLFPEQQGAAVEECTRIEADAEIKDDFNVAQLQEAKYTVIQDASLFLTEQESAAVHDSADLVCQFSMSNAIEDSGRIATDKNFKEVITQDETVSLSDAAEGLEAMLRCETEGLSGDDFAPGKVTQPANIFVAHRAYLKTDIVEVCNVDSHHRLVETTKPPPSTFPDFSTTDKEAEQVRSTKADGTDSLGNCYGDQSCQSRHRDERLLTNSRLPSSTSSSIVDETPRDIAACSNSKSNLGPREHACSIDEVIIANAGEHGQEDFSKSENNQVSLLTLVSPHVHPQDHQDWASSPQSRTCMVKTLLDSEGDETTITEMPAVFESAEGLEISAPVRLFSAECSAAKTSQPQMVEQSEKAKMKVSVADMPAVVEYGTLYNEIDTSDTLLRTEPSSNDESAKRTDTFAGDDVLHPIPDVSLPEAKTRQSTSHHTKGNVCANPNSASSPSSPSSVEESAAKIISKSENKCATVQCEEKREDDNEKYDHPVEELLAADPRVLLGERARWLVEQGEAQMAHWSSHSAPAEERARFVDSLQATSRTLVNAEATVALLLLGKVRAAKDDADRPAARDLQHFCHRYERCDRRSFAPMFMFLCSTRTR